MQWGLIFDVSNLCESLVPESKAESNFPWYADVDLDGHCKYFNRIFMYLFHQ